MIVLEGEDFQGSSTLGSTQVRESAPVSRFIVAILLKYFIKLPEGKATVFLLHLEETLLMHYGVDEVEVGANEECAWFSM